jgi:hypothetical protein
MANLTRHLISVTLMRSGLSPGRRVLAVVLCAVLALGAVCPGFALAGEADSEGEGTGTTIEVPVGPPDFEPGGEETELEEDASGEGEEEGAVVETEVEAEAPAEEETSTPETPAAPAPPAQPTYVPAAPDAAQPEAVQPPASEPVEGQIIVAPPDRRAHDGSGGGSESTPSPEATASPDAASPETGSPEAPPSPTEPAPQEVPAPGPNTSPPAVPGPRTLAGKDTYVVRPGDCLWQIAADLLGPGADAQAIGREVGRLWRMNQARIGTGDPNLIYAGTELRLH